MRARRSFRPVQLTALLLLAGGLASTPAIAQQTPYEMINAAAASSPVTVQPLRGSVSLLDGSGGNIGVLSGPDGALMVDAGIAVSRAKIEQALQSLGASNVRYVVTTHWHWDHSDGNGWLRAGGATLISTPATAAHLAETIRVEEWGHTFTPVQPADRPTMLVEAERIISLNGENVHIVPYMLSHTDGDLLVRFERADVIFAGDIYWNGLYPFIDHYERGSIDGMIRAANWTLDMAGPNTIIVPGHGPSSSRVELTAYRDMLVSVRDRVAELKRQGMTLEQVVAARPTEAFDPKWGNGPVNANIFISLVYRGV